MKKRSTKEVLAARRAEVESILVSGHWNMAVQSELAKRHGCSERSIRDDASKIRQAWKVELENHDKTEEKADWLQRLRVSILDARASGHTHSVAKLLELEARAMGHLEPLQLRVTKQEATPLELAQTILKALPMVQTLVQHAAPLAIPVDSNND